MNAWYAVYIQPRKEYVAAEHLQRQGFDVYFPRYQKRRSHARRVETVIAPLFQRYIFVSFDIARPAWRVIRSTRGVVDIVSNNLQPVPVPQAVLDELRNREDENGFVVMKHLEFQRGERVAIDREPFADVEAIFEAVKDQDRVIALLSLLGRKVVVNVPRRDVVPV